MSLLDHELMKVGADAQAALTQDIQCRVLSGHYKYDEARQLPGSVVHWVDAGYTAYATLRSPKGFDQIEQVCDTWQEANELLPVLANILRARA